MSDEEVLYSSDSEDSGSESDLSSDSESDDSSDVGLISVRQWRKINSNNPPPSPPRFPFTGMPAIQVPFEKNGSILQYFENFFSDNIVDIICTETNRYATEYVRSHRKAKPFVLLESKELKVFLALIILQGIVKKPEMEQFWSKNPIIATPFFTQAMSYQRFKQIKQYLHFSNNNQFDPVTHSQPKQNKIWPILKILVEKFKSSLSPERDITIDESLLLYLKGRLSWMQYIPLKKARFGIKSYFLCEAKSGYVWNCLIYSGKGTLPIQHD